MPQHPCRAKPKKDAEHGDDPDVRRRQPSVEHVSTEPDSLYQRQRKEDPIHSAREGYEGPGGSGRRVEGQVDQVGVQVELFAGAARKSILAGPPQRTHASSDGQHDQRQDASTRRERAPGPRRGPSPARAIANQVRPRARSAFAGYSPPLTASAAARRVWSVTAAYRRIIRSVFQPPRAITIGAVKPALRAMVAPWCRRSWKVKSLSAAPRAKRRKTFPTCSRL